MIERNLARAGTLGFFLACDVTPSSFSSLSFSSPCHRLFSSLLLHLGISIHEDGSPCFFSWNGNPIFLRFVLSWRGDFQWGRCPWDSVQIGSKLYFRWKQQKKCDSCRENHRPFFSFLLYYPRQGKESLPLVVAIFFFFFKVRPGKLAVTRKRVQGKKNRLTEEERFLFSPSIDYLLLF